MKEELKQTIFTIPVFEPHAGKPDEPREFPVPPRYHLGDGMDEPYASRKVYGYVLNRRPMFADRYYGWGKPRDCESELDNTIRRVEQATEFAMRNQKTPWLCCDEVCALYRGDCLLAQKCLRPRQMELAQTI